MTTRKKLMNLKELMKDLSRKNNSTVKKEIESFYKAVLSENKTKESGINITGRLEEINHKFDYISNENDKLKAIVNKKTNDIEEMKIVVSDFQKELNELKENRTKMYKNIKSSDIQNKKNSKNFNIFKKKNVLKKVEIDNQTKCNNKIKNGESFARLSALYSAKDKNIKISTVCFGRYDNLFNKIPLSKSNGYYFQFRWNLQHQQTSKYFAFRY